MTSTAVMSKCLAGFSMPALTVVFGRRGVVVPQFKSSTEETRKVMSFLLHDKANAPDTQGLCGSAQQYKEGRSGGDTRKM